jgi:hypothetical protein
MPSLSESIFDEMNRVRELIKEYESLPDNAGFLGASMMKVSIKRAEKAIADSDAVAMLRAYADLQKCTG